MEKVVRYIIKANGREVSWTFSRKEAERLAEQFVHECMTQTVDPFQPDITIEED